ncbi:MAG TPA: hypothetical protein PK971_14010, partial [Saprospiraceae bacterium]|nr:hypothetical protein [Saprospiraceae bacterium]
ASIKVAPLPPLPPGTVQAGPDDTLCVYGPPLALLGFPANGTWACSGCPPGALLHPAAGVWQFDPKATAPGAGAFQLTYTVGADNCAQSDSRTIVVIAAAPNAGQPQAACKNAPMQTLSAAVPPPAGFSAYWTGVPGVTDTLKGLFAPMLAGEGAHPVSLHWLHAASGCVFSAGKSFVVHPLAGSSFSIQPPYCVGQALDVQNLTPGAASQTWYDNGKPISTQADPAGIQLDSGQHLIRLVSQTAEMCPDSAEQTIVVIAPPTLVSTPDKTQGCPPLWVRFQNQFTSKDTAYYRISAPGMAPYTVPATAADSLYFAAAAQDLTYTVQLVVENKCDKVEKAFSITALSRPDALFGVSYPKPCSGEDMTVLVTSAGTPTKNTLITSTGLSLAVPLNQPFSLQFFTDTLLPVRLLLVSENGCPPPDSAEQTIVVQPAQFQALASIEADSAKLCAGDTVTLRGYALAGADTYWLNAKSGTKQFQDTIQVVVQEGLNEWTFFAEGCGYDSSGVSFFGKKPPVLSVSHLKQVCPGTPVTFGVASSGQVKLDFGDGSFATQFPAQHTYHSPSTTYLLSATATSTEG